MEEWLAAGPFREVCIMLSNHPARMGWFIVTVSSGPEDKRRRGMAEAEELGDAFIDARDRWKEAQ